jgi:hypothetical protein
VTIQSRVTATPLPGGAEFVVRATGPAVAAIKRMTTAHVQMLAADQGPRVVRTELPDGVRLVVTAPNATDSRAVARIRALGFIGLMTSGDHHQLHHVMMARGMSHH